MIERQAALEDVMLRDENNISFEQIAHIFAGQKHVGVNHRHIVPCALFRCSFVIALNFDVVKLACLVFRLNIEPDRTAEQILNRHLTFRLSDFQIISLQNRMQEILSSFFVVFKDLGHEIVVKETELCDFLAQKLAPFFFICRVFHISNIKRKLFFPCFLAKFLKDFTIAYA